MLIRGQSYCYSLLLKTIPPTDRFASPPAQGRRLDLKPQVCLMLSLQPHERGLPILPKEMSDNRTTEGARAGRDV